jgi:hypothetical protein
MEENPDFVGAGFARHGAWRATSVDSSDEA